MDGGRMDMPNSEYVTLLGATFRWILTLFIRYEEYYSRFKNLFRTKEPIPQWFIPGNHDTG